MTRSILMTVSLLLLTATVFYTERETIRDAHGKVVGTATTDGNKTVYRDAHGKVTGTATTNGNKTTYRDATGKAVGTATESGNRTTYRDSSGKTVGTATESGNKTTYRDATGKARWLFLKIPSYLRLFFLFNNIRSQNTTKQVYQEC